jgi:outer membrane protein TolC
MSFSTQFLLSRPRLLASVTTAIIFFFSGVSAVAQYSTGMGAAGYQSGQSSMATGAVAGSVPSGPATNEILHLTLRDAITQALRYNLATIESGENARIARGQRLLALSKLLPQVNAGASENVEQLNLSTFGINVPIIPKVAGPFSYSSVDANLSLTLFSFESIQHFRSARTAEQAAKLSYWRRPPRALDDRERHAPENWSSRSPNFSC